VTVWQSIIATLVTIAGVSTALHALLHKREPRAALSWCAIALMVPLLGAVLYVLFGINRVDSRARRLAITERHLPRQGYAPTLPDRLPGAFRQLARLSDTLQSWPLAAGNKVRELHNGDAAYPEMLEAIGQAEQRVCLSSYLFGTGPTGRRFIEALAAARRRGAQVRVLVDGLGEWYAWPHASRLLRRHELRVRRFHPPSLFPPSVQINLRNHRKILAIDGRIAYTGGMNIGDENVTPPGQDGPEVVDVHFRFEGPVVGQLEAAFFEDWERAGGKVPELPSPTEDAGGSALCRVLTDGPGVDMDKLSLVLEAAASMARQRLLIMTPYFLPPRELKGALVSAALRGVDVTVVLPLRNNQPLVHWASRRMMWELMKWGVRIYYQSGAFVHSKLFVVDDVYAHIGSANLDPRSLRLNFELGVEIFDASLAARLARHITGARDRSREITLDELDRRPFPLKVRDSMAWLFMPYL
jgi:cardiolipin synthase